MGSNKNAPMQDLLNFESSLPLAVILLLICFARLGRPLVCAISAWLITRKADPETRIKALEVLCSDPAFRLNLGRRQLERTQNDSPVKVPEKQPDS